MGQYPNIVPAGNMTQSLGTAFKRWNETHTHVINADQAAGGLKTELDSKATILDLQRVEGEIADAASPNYYEEDQAFYDASQERTSNTEILSPETLWLNINGGGRKLTTQVTLDISSYDAWDTKATEWAQETDYEIGDTVYPMGGSSGYVYVCQRAGTSSSLIPSWPTTPGTTYNDGSVIWSCQLDYTTGANRAGMDLYIYACIDPEHPLTPILMISRNSTVPEGYTATNSRKIGGCHCLCADVGTITDHPLSGYVTGDILPCSIWDLKHRPIGDPEGYAYDEGTDMWFSIYGLSWSGTWGSATATQPGRADDDTLALESKYGAEWADGTSSEKWHCWKFEQILARQKQRLPYQREFMSAALGANQGTNIYGSANPGTTGGHKDTGNRRMISNIGLEDTCGDHYQWGADVGSASTSGSWGNAYDANDKYEGGQVYGTVYRPLLGGPWGNAAYCGARCSAWINGALYLSAACGARGASEPLFKRTI